MRTRLLRRASVGALALTLIGATAALADNVVADGDLTSSTSTLALGDVACNVAVSKSLAVWVTRNGNVNSNVFASGSVVTFTGTPTTTELTLGTSAVTLPDTWESLSSSDKATAAPETAPQVTVLSKVAGPHTAELQVSAKGTAAKADQGGSYDLEVSLTTPITVTWNTGPCSTNVAPTAPGAPSASQNPTKGNFTLSWAPSTDTQDDAFTYTLEGKRANETFAEIVSGLTTNSYSFAPNAPAEGTWVYRVKAVEKSTSPALASQYSPSSNAVVVDRTAPNAPLATPDRPAEYTDGVGTKWWKDTVTVTFGWKGDPDLPDASIGSGEGTTTVLPAFSSSGTFSASGTATDRAGNTSDASVLSGNIDNTLPVVACPTASVVLNDPHASIAWNATDASHSSGLATPDKGTVQVDATSVGSHTVDIPAGTAVDNVGHPSEATSCTYKVAYVWNGFSQPINDTAHQVGQDLSVFKAGSTVPAKFQLKDALGNVVQASSSPVWTNPVNLGSLPLSAVVDEAAYSLTATTGTYRWDATAQQYIFNWKTAKSDAGSYWRIGVTLDDGTSHYVTIGLK